MAEALFKALIRGYETAYYNKKARKSKEVCVLGGGGDLGDGSESRNFRWEVMTTGGNYRA